MMIDYNNLNPALSNQSLYTTQPTRTFSEIFPTPEQFETEYKTSGVYDEENAISKVRFLYYLLCSRYANSNPASLDENMFKYQVFSTIFMYGPAWEVKLKAQSELRKLIESEELFDGSVNINNHAYNPGTPTTIDAFDPLKKINDQSASKWKKSKLEAFATFTELVKADVSKEFLDKFSHLFLKIPFTNTPRYITTPEEQEILGL